MPGIALLQTRPYCPTTFQVGQVHVQPPRCPRTRDRRAHPARPPSEATLNPSRSPSSSRMTQPRSSVTSGGGCRDDVKLLGVSR
jgi:hypothetical protein